MKNVVLPIVLALCASAALAQEMGKVISSTPVLQQVSVPRQVCTTQTVTTPGAKSGAGAVMGAIAGGAMGNAVGDGSGRAIATMIGLVGGAILGDKVEGAGPAQTQNVQNCSTQNFYETRTQSYNVIYEYAGKQYTVNMPTDPGPYVKLQITPVISAPTPAAPAQQVQPISSIQYTTSEQTYVVAPRRIHSRPYYAPADVTVYLDDDGRGPPGHNRWR